MVKKYIKKSKMDWEFLTDISLDIEIPIVQPYNRLLKNKSHFYDCYIKIGDVYVDFINGHGLAYSDFLASTLSSRTELYNNRPVIADLTLITREFGMAVASIQDTISTILDLYILGRLHHRQATPVDTLLISKKVIFPVLYILNILGSRYHIDALLTFALAEIYNKIFERSFSGYSKEDRQSVRFYLTLLIGFESSNTEIIYRFLYQNRNYCRFVDLLGVIKDYMTLTYYQEIAPIINRLMIAGSDQYIIMESTSGIPFFEPLTIVDRRQPTFKSASSFDSKDQPCIIFNTRNYSLPAIGITRIITPQMIQDRLPLDINRVVNITLEGVLCSILLPIIKVYFTPDTLTDKTPLVFSIHYVAEPAPALTCMVHRVDLVLTVDSLSLTLNPGENFRGDKKEELNGQLTNYILMAARDKVLINIKMIDFDEHYPEDVGHVSNILGLSVVPKRMEKSPEKKERSVEKILSPKKSFLSVKGKVKASPAQSKYYPVSPR